MLPENRIPTHPGEILLEEFLIPLKLSQVAFARHIGVPVQRINRDRSRQARRDARYSLAVCSGAEHNARVLDQPAKRL